MSASMAHELNNPLTTVLGYARLLLEDKPTDHADRTGLELIAAEAARMKGIVGSLLDYARSERAPGLSEPADVNATLRHTAALLLPELRRSRVEIALALAEPLPRVAADPHALQQVFVNLAQNAAQAMRSGGTITIESRLAPGDVAVEVAFVDDGPGVPAADRARVFDPFYTTKEPGAGTGLGLAVCKHLVTGFGGGIDVGDAPGRGARFRVLLPVAV
jgi:two-component system NtrC family sensor kinase